jgi:hypothetical protein
MAMGAVHTPPRVEHRRILNDQDAGNTMIDI